MIVVETTRLQLRWLTELDADFICALLNDPGWLRHIGDRQVRNSDDARAYLRNGPLQMYAQTGFGLYAVVRKSDALLLGMCGLLKRESLPDVDIGYALLEQFAGQGYAQEAAVACVNLAREQFGLTRLIAITTPDNVASARLLGKLGMQFEERFLYSASNEWLHRYAMAL